MSEALTYGFTDAELDIAKHTDLLSLLPSLGYAMNGWACTLLST